MKQIAFAVPGDLDAPTGGYAYDRRIIAELRKCGTAVEVIALGDGFPWPSDATRAAAAKTLECVPANTPILIDGLAFGALPELAGAFCATRPVIALVHHPLALETGLAADEARQLQASERAALAGARCVVATSDATARLLAADYAVPRERITVARPGSDRVAKTRVSTDGPVKLLAVGSLVPRKGHDVLIAALAELTDLNWRLTIAGARDRDPKTARRIDVQIAALGLKERVFLAGAVAPDGLPELYVNADIFVLASRFEGYGMAFAEAASHGLPIIGTTAGAIPDTVPAEAGLLVPPDDVAALAITLRRLIAEHDTRERLAAAARASADRLPTWDAAARAITAAIEAAA